MNIHMLVLGVATITPLAAAAQADADHLTYSLAAGAATARFNVSSGELTGPAGSTPGGIRAGLDSIRTVGLEFGTRRTDGWGLSLAAGTPPVIHFTAQGAAAALGRIGSARAWFPAVLASWAGPAWGPLRPVVSAGVNYTTYSDATVYANYTTAMAGQASQAQLTSSFGLVGRLGAEFSLDESWFASLSWSRYGIRTTARITTDTAGLGAVTRSIHLRADPDVYALLVGRRF